MISMVFEYHVCSEEGIKERLKHLEIKANKALGQNFFRDADELEAILDFVEVSGKNVLEIGAGLGALTNGLLERGANVIAVEKDAAMVRILDETFDKERLKIIHKDFLDVDIASLELGENSVCMGNLPYYVTTPIAMHVVMSNVAFSHVLFMVQREAAERFVAAPKAKVYGPLAVATALQYDAKIVMDLSPKSYFPAPDVHSSIVLLERKAEPLDAGFLSFIKTVFAMRRKTLANNLSSYDKAAVMDALAKFPPSVRAEALSPEELKSVYEVLK